MRKKRKLLGTLLCLLLVINCIIPTCKVSATTMEDQAVNTVKFGEYDTLELKKEISTLKLVLKQKGDFVLDFAPKNIYATAELYNEQNVCLGYYIYSNSEWRFKNLEAGTYYLRYWTQSEYRAGTYTYFARFIPSDDTSVEICINLKKGRSIQLGTIFANTQDRKAKWSTSNKKVATVNSKGKVTGKRKGTATIKVTNSSGLVAKIKVKVTN